MIKPIDYKQIDSKYSSYPYSNKDENTTLGKAGCGVACSAMVIASLVNKSITPIDTAKWSLKNGYKCTGSGTYYSYFVPQFKKYGIGCKRLNTNNIYGNISSSVHTSALNHLKNGGWLICCMGKGNWTSSGHYILVYGYKNGYVYINDPASYKTNRLKNKWSLLISQVKYYWTVDIPEIKDSFKKSTATNYQIKWLQEKLGVGVDGIWGKKTAKAVKNLRKKFGWKPGYGYTATEKFISKL